MSVLIVDCERQTIRALRALLREDGYQSIWSARNFEEANQVLKVKKSRVQVIISDLEMPKMDGVTLAEKVSYQPDFEYTCFLLIFTGLSRARLKKIMGLSNRLDAFLAKPFYLKTLSQGISDAYRHRLCSRNRILFFSEKTDSSFEQEVQNLFRKKEICWNQVIHSRSPKEAQEKLKFGRATIGLVIIDSNLGGKIDMSWLNYFRKSAWGFATVVIGLGTDPHKMGSLRTQAEIFVQEWENKKVDWVQVLRIAARRANYKWTAKIVVQRIKKVLSDRGFGRAQQILAQAWAEDPTQVQIGAMLADCFEWLGDPGMAVRIHLNILKSNPCFPRSYIKVFENWERNCRPNIDFPQLIENAHQYCPAHREVQNWVRKMSKVFRNVESEGSY